MARMFEVSRVEGGVLVHAACGAELGAVYRSDVLRRWWHGPDGVGASTRGGAVNQLVHRHIYVTGCAAYPDPMMGVVEAPVSPVQS